MKSKFNLTKVFLFAVAMMSLALAANATVALSPLFGTNMVLQRGKSIPVSGTASANKTITVTFNGQTKTAISDSTGAWQLSLDSMVAKATGGNFTAAEAGANTVTLTNVVVGDVWICSGQSNMDWGLAGCDRPADIASANYPVMRQFRAPLVTSATPLKTISGTWDVCSPSTAGSFSAVAFYFGRKICQDQSSAIPIGIYLASVGGTKIDPWLAPEGASDIPVLAPLYSQNIIPWGPFCLFNGMVYPYSPLPAKGMLWYQGENAEITSQSADSYYLKMKALAQGYKRMLGVDDFAFYFVQLAYWGTLPTDATPVLISGGWDADTRIQQANAMAIPHSGMASAMDVGSSLMGDQVWDGWHPKDKFDVGERLALWALKNEYGRSIPTTSGPVLRDVTVSGNTLICSFDNIGNGLMVGSKEWYLPTAEIVGGTLQKFSISGASGTWYAGNATIVGDTVVVSHPSVTTPRRIAYACWQNPVGANLYNRVTLDGVANGLPASPFYVDDVITKYTITATPGANGSISPGTSTYLKRATALYTITPNAGYYTTDVKVDGVSVGSVKYYTFDPLYANHTITATFATTAPSHTITTTSTASGAISPAGPLSIGQGGSQTFKMVPNTGCRLISVTVDGALLGTRNSVTFADVRTAHTLNAVFAPIPTPGTGTGLRGDYYEGTNFNIFRLSRTDATVNFDWGTGSPNAIIPVEGFSVRWTGQIQPQFSEAYKFYLSHDDGARLWINNTLVIDKWTGAGTDDVGSITLVAGQKYDIKLEYLESLSNANCKLEWYSQSLPREVVPSTQLFPATTPIYTITATPGANGSFSPSGSVLSNPAGSQTFSVVPSTGYLIADVKVDNVSVGAVSSYTFTNITANHTITATFTALPSYTVSGKVIKQGTTTPLVAAKVNFYTSSTAVGAAAYTATTNATGDYTISIPMGTWRVVATATSYFNSATQSLTINNANVANVNFALADGTRNIPQTTNLIMSALTDTLPTSGNTGAWATYIPATPTLTTIGSPTAELVMGRKWEKNVVTDGDGYRFGTAYSTPIACTGATIVAAAKPIRSADSGNWRSIVDVFYNRLVLGIMNNNGQVCVWRNGDLAFSGSMIPDGQTTILSMVVQSDSSYAVYANGVSILTGAAKGAGTFTSLVPAVPGTYASYINVGRNDPDGWTTYNGYIGDVFLYKTALTTAERQAIEADLTAKFISGGATTYTINASAGAGGAVTPAGSTFVTPGASQTYTITPNAGYSTTDVIVDGVSVGIKTSHTFTNVTAPHSISATFALTTKTITASAGANGSISPTGSVIVNYGSNQTFTITPNSGYKIASVTVDGVNAGTSGTYTFTNVTINHTIAAAFAVNTFAITASAGSNGSVTPSGVVTVNNGASQAFTFTPSAGYGIIGMNVDGDPVTPVRSYTFSNVTANHSIGATFAKLIAMSNKSAMTDAKAKGRLIKIWGKPNSINAPTSFRLSDGYSSLGLLVMVNGATLPAGFDTSKTVVVTGILMGNPLVLNAQEIK